MGYASLFLIRMSQFRLKILVLPPDPWVFDYNPDQTLNGTNTNTGRHGQVISSRFRSRRLPGLGLEPCLKLFIASFSLLGMYIDSTLNRPRRLLFTSFPFHYQLLTSVPDVEIVACLTTNTTAMSEVPPSPCKVTALDSYSTDTHFKSQP